MDMTEQYNTPLSPQEENDFQMWMDGQTALHNRDITKDLNDYDLRGAWLRNPNLDLSGHLTDTFKKPNHPTFSVESIYHGADQAGQLTRKLPDGSTASVEMNPGKHEGGSWEKLDDGSWSFTPGATNLQMHETQDLIDYFNKVEPGNKLVLPGY